MIRYLSTRGNTAPTDFAEAVLQGFAADGGLFVPDQIPRLSTKELKELASLNYPELACRLLRPFITRDLIDDQTLALLINKSFASFPSADPVTIRRLQQPPVHMAELFHGPTLSFKDVAMGFLINTMDHLLGQRNEHLSIILATTGDTGPAAAWAAAGCRHIDCWPLYPSGRISEEQERQMTTIAADNIHPLGVSNCDNGGDDLDVVVARLFGDTRRRNELHLSSVNSINWCRVLVQAIHYFHAYFQAVKEVGQPVVFSVPAGAFGNLFAGYLAKEMGLPVRRFICATNANGTLHRLFATGSLSRQPMITTWSSAIDIVVPYNVWRLLYFHCGPERLRTMMDRFEQEDEIVLEPELLSQLQALFISTSVSDEKTLEVIRASHRDNDGYLLDPHAAVAVAAVEQCRDALTPDDTVICLATAHPAKFPQTFQAAFGAGQEPAGWRHPDLEAMKALPEFGTACRLDQLEQVLTENITRRIHHREQGA